MDTRNTGARERMIQSITCLAGLGHCRRLRGWDYGKGNKAPCPLHLQPFIYLETHVICHLSVPDKFLPQCLEAARSSAGKAS